MTDPATLIYRELEPHLGVELARDLTGKIADLLMEQE